MKSKVKNLAKRLTGGVLAMMMLTSICLSFISCAPPKLEEVKGTFAELIENSKEVNRILFGEGLSIYGSMLYNKDKDVHYSIIHTKEQGKLCVYYDKEKKENISLRFGEKGEDGELIYSDADKGIYLYSSDFVDKEPAVSLPQLPAGYNLVRFDERCTTMREIATFAGEVYSEDYLGGIFESIMGKSDGAQMDIDNPTFSKYIEFVDSFDGKKYLLRADSKTYPPVTLEERRYDYDTMKIVKPSKKNYVTVEISSYGTYADIESAEIKLGWSKTKLNFVCKGGIWRLDSPTY